MGMTACQNVGYITVLFFLIFRVYVTFASLFLNFFILFIACRRARSSTMQSLLYFVQDRFHSWPIAILLQGSGNPETAVTSHTSLATPVPLFLFLIGSVFREKSRSRRKK